MFYITNRPTVVAESFGDETVIINMETGVYYSLEGSAGAAWSLLEQGCTADELIDQLVAAYDIDRAALGNALQSFLEELLVEGLARQAASGEARSGALAAPLPPAGSVYSPPGIKKYEDLQDLLLLDPIHEVDEEMGWPNLKPESPQE
ncbi:MAG: PqqD family protein [Chloroflexi bacterium]|nr:PqqD family protein [Chloroflexota bacterium]